MSENTRKPGERRESEERFLKKKEREVVKALYRNCGRPWESWQEPKSESQGKIRVFCKGKRETTDRVTTERKWQ